MESTVYIHIALHYIGPSKNELSVGHMPHITGTLMGSGRLRTPHMYMTTEVYD